MDLVKVTLTTSFSLSLLFVLLYFLFSGTRIYFIFLAFVFAALGMLLLIPTPFMRIAMLLLASVALIMAISNIISDTRERVAALHHEQHEREAAFSDMMQEMRKLNGNDPHTL